MLRRLESRLLFGRTRHVRPLPLGPHADSYALSAQSLLRPDGVMLEGWSARSRKASQARQVLIYFGGRNEHVAWAPLMASYLPGWEVHAFNYRGMGASGGWPSEALCKADAMAIYRHVMAQGAEHAAVHIAGRSLGTAVAIWLAAQVPARKLALLSPFESMDAVLRSQALLRPLRGLFHRWPRQRFDSRALLPQVEAEVLVMLAEHDTRVPPSLSRAAARGFKRVRPVTVTPGTTHRTLPRHRLTQEALAIFLQGEQD